MELFITSNKCVLHTFFFFYTILRMLIYCQSNITDAYVTCIYSEDCILPCTFPLSTEEVVFQWYKDGTPIFSFLKDEDKSNTSKISVFIDEVPHGNASLLLKDINIKSRGRYKCVVNISNDFQESDVIARVEAPISGIAIRIDPIGHVQCSSHGVYPAPMLKWSTQPHFASMFLQAVTRIDADLNGLYSIKSSLKKISTNSNLTYICSITSKYTSQSWKASLHQTEITVHAGQNLVIPCMAPKNLKNFTISWTFTSMDMHANILTYYSQTHRIKIGWDAKAKLDLTKALMGDGSLYLNNLVSNHSGTYTCTFTGSQVKYIVQTLIKTSVSNGFSKTGNSGSKLWVLAIIIAVLVLLCVIFYRYRKCQAKSEDSRADCQQDTEMTAIHEDNVEVLPAVHNKEDSFIR